jgi:LysR family transcriptional regulator (chromosome initiation inhibitor)
MIGGGFLLRLDNDALAVLAAIVRTGSFEGAAKSLGVTQSATSQRIKQLEETVGSILIIRGRPCLPTEAGLVLFSHFEQIELLQAETIAKLHGEGAKASATRVRVSVNVDSLATWFPFVVKQASEDLNMRIEVVSDDQEYTEQRLRSGDALAAISSSRMDIPGCKRIALGIMQYVAVASPEFYSKHFPDGVTAEKLASAPSIAFDPKDTLPGQWMASCFGETTTLNSHQMPSYEGHLLCALHGVGWAIMPLLTVQPMIAAGDLVDISPQTRVSVPLNWYFTSQSSHTLSALSKIVEGKAAELLVSQG